MQIELLLSVQIFKFFVMIFMGYLIVKLGMLRAAESRVLSVVSVYLVMPCVIFNAFQVSFSQEKLQGLLLSAAVACLIHLILWGVMRLSGILFHLDVVEKASIMYSNAGNMVIPVIAAVLGEEWVFYSSAFVSVQIILLWTHCSSMLGGSKKLNFKKIFMNINMAAIFLGLICFFGRIAVPELALDTLRSVGSMFAPISMFITGMLLSNISVRNLLFQKRVWMVIFLRMVACPLLVLVFLYLSGMASRIQSGEMVLLVTFLAAITPVSSTITQMVQLYGEDADYACTLNIATTLVCIVTMPIMVKVYGSLFHLQRAIMVR